MTVDKKFCIAVHGGLSDSGYADADFDAAAHATLKAAVALGSELLSNGASAVEAVEAVTVLLENAEVFNAGKGAAYNTEGAHEVS